MVCLIVVEIPFVSFELRSAVVALEDEPAVPVFRPPLPVTLLITEMVFRTLHFRRRFRDCLTTEITFNFNGHGLAFRRLL